MHLEDNSPGLGIDTRGSLAPIASAGEFSVELSVGVGDGALTVSTFTGVLWSAWGTLMTGVEEGCDILIRFAARGLSSFLPSRARFQGSQRLISSTGAWRADAQLSISCSVGREVRS